MDWRVFIIGPMNDEYEGHIERLRDYFVKRLINVRKYRRAGGAHSLGTTLEKTEGKVVNRVIVMTPDEHEMAGNIPMNVFHQIDNADLVIADLSGKRAAVVYELAFAHALGIETILVGDNDDQLFYLKQYRFNKVNFKKKVASSTLDGHIDLWLDKRRKLPNAPNPIHEFYGAPLLDISTASGLAAGFYDNFARPVLTSGVIVERRQVSQKNRPSVSTVEESRPIKGLIVARPLSLRQEIRAFENELSESLQKSFKKKLMRGKPGELFIGIDKNEGGIRTPFFVVNDYVIDVPRTMFSMKFSRRLERLRGAGPQIDQNMQQVLIECFFHSLLNRIDQYRELQVRIRSGEIEFHIGTANQIAEIIKTGRSEALLFLKD